MSKTHMIRHSEAEAGASAHHPIAPDPVCPEEPAANSGGTNSLVDMATATLSEGKTFLKPK